MHMNGHGHFSPSDGPQGVQDVDCESPSTPTNSAANGGGDGSTRCDCCKSCGAILELDGCGHRFHPRCIYTYPITQCELCSVPVTTVKIFRPFKNSPNSMARKGKWSADEHKYANMMMKQFQMGAMPLVDGLHLRGFIANLLQCDPLRVTKKYSGHAIGKQNFYYQRHKSYCYNLHTKMQKRISSLRNHFYWHIQYRCKFGYSMNIQELKSCEADYWIREFGKFANKVGQSVTFVASPMPIESPVQPPAPPASPREEVSTYHPVAVSMPVPATHAIVKTEAVEEPAVVEQVQPPQQAPPSSAPMGRAARRTLLVDVQEPVDASQQPSFKLSDGSSSSSSTTNGAVSPLSFDEWREEEAPSFIDMLDKTLLTDFAKQQSQFSATLGGDDLDGDTQATDASSASSSSQQSQSQTTRCSLRDWLLEEETRWNDSMAVSSWSFSLTLSEV